jgi:LacI family transcriptional regulator
VTKTAPHSASSPAPKLGPTLRDLARQLGVSRTTISLALNNHPRIPEETRARVRAAAAKFGYAPDPQVARLMSYLRLRRRSPAHEVIAVLHAFPQRDPWATNTHLRTMHESTHARASSRGFSAEDFWLAEPGMTPARLSAIFRARGITGVVLLPFPHYTPTLELDWPNFASAALGHSLGVPVHRVSPHQYRDTRTALRKLAALGYRRAGLVLNPDVDERVEHYFMAAYLIEQKSRGSRQRMTPLLFTKGRDQFLRWIDAAQPDALLLAQPPPARSEVLGWLEGIGLRCPRDVGLALLDVPHDRKDTTSGIRQSYAAIGGAAMDFVIAQILRGERGLPGSPQLISLEGQWQNGTTTRRMRTSYANKAKSGRHPASVAEQRD